MRRIKILVSYDGTGYHGWQVQPGLPTIQAALEQVISEIEGRLVQVAGSGRTDAGVHAVGQVAAFSIENPIPVDNLRRAMNRLLPRDIRVLSVEDAALDFHPRFQAKRKTYEYRIFHGEICSPFDRLYVCHHPYPLAIEEMIALAPLLEGEHDFRRSRRPTIAMSWGCPKCGPSFAPGSRLMANGWFIASPAADF